MSRSKTQNTLLGVAGVATIIVGASLLALPRSNEWTSASVEAQAEFAASMEASQKLYFQDSRIHLERALELDPDFVAAKVKMSESCRSDDSERSERLLREAIESDQSRLTDRERFMVKRAALLDELKFDEANDQLDAYIDDHPNDPYVIHIKALQAWQRGELESAEKLNKRLLEISPNWVLAYNQLGYITMMQGRFTEAEEFFTSYRFIAPDQANPHDSLGELFIVLGRYDEAEESLLRALDNKPDFGAAFEHLAIVDALREDWEGAHQRLAQGAETGSLSEESVKYQDCALRFWRMANDADWEAITELAAGDCPLGKHKNLQVAVYLHNAASHLKDWKLAMSMEESIESEIKEAGPEMNSWISDMLVPTLHHMRGVRFALQKDLDSSIEAFETADKHLTYINSSIGLFKLSNRLVLAHVLREHGLEDKAHALVTKVRVVNPSLVEQWERHWALESGS